MLNVMLALVNALWYVMNDVAGTKTRRYVLMPLMKNIIEHTDAQNLHEGQPKDLVRVVVTFMAVLTKRSRTSTISVDEDVYPVGDYKFPDRWWEIAHIRRVYVSDQAVDKMEPLFKLEESETPDVALMTPFQVEKFFKEFNENQADGVKIAICSAPESFDSYAVLNELSALTDANGDVVPMFASGTVSEEASVVAGYLCPFKKTTVTSVSRSSEEVMSRWLISLS